ncbi:tetratricopeptide repeat protein [Paracoccaceae bacterium]|nr:tetratricopeptide repeat protein [Paracoccaceae bacterium]
MLDNIGHPQNPAENQIQHLIKLYNQGKLGEVFEQTSTLTKQYPNSLVLWNLLGASAAQTGRLDKAVDAFKKAISIKPDYADAYNNMGNALKGQGKLEEAIEAYNKALSINPDYTEAYYNMGNALKEQGKLDEAIEAYKKALSIKPDNSRAYNNMGNALQDQGNLEEAMKAYTKAISIKPDYTEAYYNMGNVLKDKGKIEEAIEAYTKALSINPDYTEAYYSMGNVLTGVTFNKPSREIHKTIVSLLDSKTYVRPKDIVSAAISLLKFEPSLQKCLQLADNKVIENPSAVISDLNNLPLLLKLMSVCPLPDLGLENLFRKLRASLLLSISDVTSSPELLNFQSALALQCFTNEYIYSHTEEEEKLLQSLETNLPKMFKNNEQPAPQIILALASYKSLNQYEWANSLLVNSKIEDVFIRQIAEPNQEAKLKFNLPLLADITDEVSSKVRDQYEESPYPRWVNTGSSSKPMSISNVVSGIKLKLHDYKITEVEKPEILVAGCGTGQHSIRNAIRFKDSKVLAIDLSLSSLGYAKRKTEELGVGNIEYMQADILDLSKLGKKFDIVESVGVLHHMDNPAAGWRVLTNCLKPGGLMKIGLYSELARQDIVEIRKEISNAGIGSNDEEMKSFRDTIIGSEKDHHERILNFIDFYSLSELKDLLFHVQEHRFTIPQVRDCLSKFGLKFCGFETPKEILSHFHKSNAGAGNPYNLEKWQAYEKANPKTFAGMYQFWCQKVV